MRHHRTIPARDSRRRLAPHTVGVASVWPQPFTRGQQPDRHRGEQHHRHTGHAHPHAREGECGLDPGDVIRIDLRAATGRRGRRPIGRVPGVPGVSGESSGGLGGVPVRVFAIHAVESITGRPSGQNTCPSLTLKRMGCSKRVYPSGAVVSVSVYVPSTTPVRWKKPGRVSTRLEHPIILRFGQVTPQRVDQTTTLTPDLFLIGDGAHRAHRHRHTGRRHESAHAPRQHTHPVHCLLSLLLIRAHAPSHKPGSL